MKIQEYPDSDVLDRWRSLRDAALTVMLMLHDIQLGRLEMSAVAAAYLGGVFGHLMADLGAAGAVAERRGIQCW